MSRKTATMPTEDSILKVVETDSREAIKDGSRTIAYIAIGAEAWSPLLAASPKLLAIAQRYVSECGECAGVGIDPEDHDCEYCQEVRQVIKEAKGEA